MLQGLIFHCPVSNRRVKVRNWKFYLVLSDDERPESQWEKWGRFYQNVQVEFECQGRGGCGQTHTAWVFGGD